MPETAKSILKELKSLGSEGTAKTLMRHGAQDPCYGVKVGDLQKIRKRIKTDYRLALELYDSGVYDAMYFAGLIADDAKMTKANLRKWAKQAYGASLAAYTVPWVATGSPHGPALAQEWIDSKDEGLAAIGWSTLNSILSVVADEDLDIPLLKKQLRHVAKVIHKSPDGVREAMNGFVIGAGSFVEPLHDLALELGEKIGPVTVNHGDTACKTPFAPDYIRKVAKMGRVGKKKKTVKC